MQGDLLFSLRGWASRKEKQAIRHGTASPSHCALSELLISAAVSLFIAFHLVPVPDFDAFIDRLGPVFCGVSRGS